MKIKIALFYFSFVFIVINVYGTENDYNDRCCHIDFNGTDFSGKNYYLVTSTPSAFHTRNEKYVLWNILKDKGFQCTNYKQAELIVLFRIDPYITDYGLYYDYSITAYKNYYKQYEEPYPYWNESLLPYWNITFEGHSYGFLASSLMHFLYFVDWFWGETVSINYRDYHPEIKKIKYYFRDGKKSIFSKEDMIHFQERINELTNNKNVDLYNKEML